MDALYALHGLVTENEIPKTMLDDEFERIRQNIEEKDIDSTILASSELPRSEGPKKASRRTAIAAALWDDVHTETVRLFRNRNIFC